MTVYMAFNEAEGLDDVTNVEDATEMAISGVARSGFTFGDNGSTPQSADATLSSPLSECWVHFTGRVESDGFSRLEFGSLFDLYDDDGNSLLTISHASGVVEVSTVLDSTGSTTIFTIGFNTNFTVDIHLSVNSSGFIKVYVDSILKYNQTGDTVASTSATGVETLRFRDPGYIAGELTSSSNEMCFGQVLVSDSNTIGALVYTLDHTTTTDSINDWAVGDINDIDEFGVNDTDLLSTDTDNDQFTYDSSITLSAPSGVEAYTAVVQTWRGSYDAGASVTNITPFLNDTTSTSTSFGTSQGLTTSFANYRKIWDTDPADSGNWTATKINNYEFGIQADT